MHEIMEGKIMANRIKEGARGMNKNNYSKMAMNNLQEKFSLNLGENDAGDSCIVPYCFHIYVITSNVS